MAGRKKSKFDNKFRSISGSESRIAGVREEREVKDDLPKLCLNFKDFDFNQCPPGQKLSQWEEAGMLSKLMDKFISICSYNRIEAVQLKLLKIYGSFPANGDFKLPLHVQGEVDWGTIQRIGGQKPRLAGYIIGNVFYPVFLDRDHKFFPSQK